MVAERQFTTGAAAEQLLAKCYTRTNRANVRLVRGFPGREFQKGRKAGRGLTRTARGGLGTQWKLRKGGNHRVSGRWFIGSPEGSSGSHHRRGFVRSPDSLSSHRSQHGLSDTSNGRGVPAIVPAISFVIARWQASQTGVPNRCGRFGAHVPSQ